MRNTRNLRSGQSQNPLVPGMAKDYISQVSEEIEDRFIKKLSEEFSRRESRILGALSKFDEFLLNPQVRTCSVAFPGTSMNSNSENREPTGDRLLGDSCPKTVFSACHSENIDNFEQEEPQNMVSGVHEEGRYCCCETLSGKQKKAGFTSQPQFRS